MQVTPVAVENEIMRLCARLDALTEELATKARAAGLTDARYKAEHAKEFLAARGKTVAEREVMATVGTITENEARKIAEAELLAVQEAGRNIRAQLDALRSVNANVRNAVGL